MCALCVKAIGMNKKGGKINGFEAHFWGFFSADSFRGGLLGICMMGIGVILLFTNTADRAEELESGEVCDKPRAEE